jgi:hypothetical protein
MNGSIRTVFAQDQDVAAAVRAAQAALSGEPADLIVAFIGGKHGPEAALAALRAAFPGVTLTGGAAAGVISSHGFGYGGFEIGLIAFHGPDVTPAMVATHDLLAGEFAAGENLGRSVHDRTADGQAVFLLFDSVASVAPLRLHPASQIMAGFQSGLGARELHVVGGGLLTDINLSGGWLLDGADVCKHAAAALIFPPGIAAETVIFHGCRPASSFLEITKIDGAEVLELNGEPALTVVERMLGLTLGTTSGQQLSLVATLGQKQGDPFAPFDENAYVNRLILQANPERGSLTLFEPDFEAGARVQIMSRDNILMLESVTRGVADLRRLMGSKKTLLGLYIDCAGRASVMSGAETEEAELVVDSLAPEFPFMGFYSGVEIAPFAGGTSRPLDWTGVLTVLQTAS